MGRKYIFPTTLHSELLCQHKQLQYSTIVTKLKRVRKNLKLNEML